MPTVIPQTGSTPVSRAVDLVEVKGAVSRIVRIEAILSPSRWYHSAIGTQGTGWSRYRS
jgi:hypothetical protein